MTRRDDTPRDLLFGLLALQTGMVSRDQLILAFGLWTGAPGRPLAELLTAQGAIRPEHRPLIDALVEAHLKLHGGDPEKSLAAIDLNRSTRESLAGAGGPEVEATLGHVGSGSGSGTEDDAERTGTYAVGSASSDGQRFRVLRPHASGGLGAVFVALDAELNREVALKQILDRHADDPVSRQRFLLEAEITGGLEHPGIVPVYGLGNYGDGRPYYAMRFVRGDSLKEAIERFHADARLKRDRGARSLELRKLLRRFTDVCNAIEYAHSRGVLHRDIKPGNVIVGRHGETLVIDWGLAKPMGRAEPGHDAGERTLMPSSASGSSETLPGSALGTPGYMSPEQACGDHDRLGPRSDVYSLGATLYCLLTGQAPFSGDVGDVLRKVERGEFPPPRAVDPSIDRALEAICLAAMALKPEGRYASGRALADDVERWTADEPVSVYQEPASVRLTRWGRRHRTAAASTAVLAVTAVVGLSVGAVLINRERAKAEANFRQARAAVDRYFTTVSESRLLDVPGLQPLRKELLDAAQEYYGDFLRKRGNDPSVRADAAAASFRVGWINVAIGRTGEALEPYRTATALYEQLARDHPEVAEYRRILAICQGALGLLLPKLERRDEGLRAHLKALEIREALAKAQPGDILALNDVARTHRNIGDIHRMAGKVDEAVGEWDKALAIGESLLRGPMPKGDSRVDLTGRSDPSAIVREDLAVLQLDRANLLRQSGKTGAAEAALTQARELLEQLARERPSDQKILSHLADAHVNEGRLCVDRGRLEDAERSFGRGLEIFEGLAAANPKAITYRSAAAKIYLNLGWTLKSLGRSADALAGSRAAIALAEGLLADEPGSAEYRNLLVQGLTQSGNTLLKEGRTAEALVMLRRALEIEEALARDQSEVIVHESALTNTLRGVGRAEAAAGHPAAARAAFERASKIDLSLAKNYPSARFNLACSLALMIPVSEPDRREDLAVQAVEALRQAIADGYANVRSVKNDSDLDALHARADFQALLAMAQAKAGPVQ